MKFEERVNELSQKYQIEHGPLYDAMLKAKWKTRLANPLQYVFHRRAFNENFYNSMEDQPCLQRQLKPEKVVNQTFYKS